MNTLTPRGADGTGVTLRVKLAAVPSVTGEVPAEMVTTGFVPTVKIGERPRKRKLFRVCMRTAASIGLPELRNAVLTATAPSGKEACFVPS